jgi:hypothetical protein
MKGAIEPFTPTLLVALGLLGEVLSLRGVKEHREDAVSPAHFID